MTKTLKQDIEKKSSNGVQKKELDQIVLPEKICNKISELMLSVPHISDMLGAYIEGRGVEGPIEMKINISFFKQQDNASK